MANLNGKSYSNSVNSKRYLIVPTASTRRRGMYYKWYSSSEKGGYGQWIDPRNSMGRRATHDPRKLPVPITYSHSFTVWFVIAVMRSM